MSEHDTVIRDCDTVDEIRKAALNAVFPVVEDERPDQYIQMHWCDQCKKYHKAR